MIEKKIREFLKELNETIVEAISEDNVEDKMEYCLAYGCTVVSQLQWVQSRLKEILGEE